MGKHTASAVNAPAVESVVDGFTTWETPTAVPEADAAHLLSYIDQRRDVGVAYLLWMFGGAFGAHRYYTGRHSSAVWMTILSLSLIGLIVTGVWAMVDGFSLARITQEHNQKLSGAALAGHYGVGGR